MYSSMIEFRAEVNNSINSLREDLNVLNDSVSNLSMCVQEHKKQTETELADLHTSQVSTQTSFTSQLAELQTSLNSTHSKLDSLTATTAQLSDHQQIQDNISDLECLDTKQSLELHQNLQDNLTYQLEKIHGDINFILEQHWCGGTGGWRRVVYLDMANSSTTCPSGWKLTEYSKRTCGRATDGTNTCDSATFPVLGREYSKICGRIRAYQWGSPDAFTNYQRQIITIDGAYIDGVSVTHGTPRNHIWTFAAGVSESNPTWDSVCPCDTSRAIRVPSFVGDDYFCESGLNEPWAGQLRISPNDILWDGEDCLPSSTCCSRYNPPYFVKQLPNSTTNDIEARICLDEPLSNENIAVELVELYIQWWGLVWYWTTYSTSNWVLINPWCACAQRGLL